MWFVLNTLKRGFVSHFIGFWIVFTSADILASLMSFFLGANCRNIDVIVLVIYSINLAGAIVRRAIDSSVDVEFQLDMKVTGHFITLQDSYPTRHAVRL